MQPMPTTMPTQGRGYIMPKTAKPVFAAVKINVFNEPKIGPSVSGRELYRLTSVSVSERDLYSDFFLERKRRFGLVEGKDFVCTTVPPGPTNRRALIEHIVSLSAAKQIAQAQPAKRGMGVLAYLETYEKGEVPAEAPTPQPSLFTEPTPAKPAEVIPANNPENEPAKPLSERFDAMFIMRKQSTFAAIAKLQRDLEKATAQDGATSTVHRLRTTIEHHRTSAIALSLLEIGMALTDCATAVLNCELTPLLKSDNGLIHEEPTTRMKIVRLVDAYAAAKSQTHQAIWNSLYGQLMLRFGFDAWAHTQGKKDPNYLDAVEESGQLDNLFTIAKEALTPMAN